MLATTGNQFRMSGATTGSGHSQSEHEATKDGDVEPSGVTPGSANASYTFIGGHWQFNMATTNLDVGTYTYHIDLMYGTYISLRSV
jgi:hypothetical protein